MLMLLCSCRAAELSEEEDDAFVWGYMGLRAFQEGGCNLLEGSPRVGGEARQCQYHCSDISLPSTMTAVFCASKTCSTNRASMTTAGIEED